MAKLKLLFSACFCIWLASAEKYRETIHVGKGIPVPHAAFLEHLIKKAMFPNKTAEQSFLEMYGDVSDLDNATLARLQSLEFSVLDADNVKLYAKLARRCMQRSQALAANETSGRRLQRNAFRFYDTHIMKTMLTLMQQSIFNSRLTLQRTNAIRAKFRSDISFNIGQMYGSLMELNTKAARVFLTMHYLTKEVWNKLLWYLMLYERMLQIHTDATDYVQRIFQLNREGAQKLINENPAAEVFKDDAKKKKRKTGKK